LENTFAEPPEKLALQLAEPTVYDTRSARIWQCVEHRPARSRQWRAPGPFDHTAVHARQSSSGRGRDPLAGPAGPGRAGRQVGDEPNFIGVL